MQNDDYHERDSILSSSGTFAALLVGETIDTGTFVALLVVGTIVTPVGPVATGS